MKKLISVLLLALAVVTTANAQEFLGNLRGKQGGKGNVTVSQSKEIDDLVNGHARQQQTQQQQTAAPVQQQKTQSAQQQQKTQPAQQQQKTQPAQQQQKTQPAQRKVTTPTQTQHTIGDRVVIPQSQQQQTKKETPHTEKTTTKKEPRAAQQQQPVQDNDDYSIPTVDTSKKVMRRSYRMQGYRIQVYSGGNSRQDKQKAYNAGAIMKANFPELPVYAHFKSPSWKCRMGNFKSQYEAEKYLPRVKKLGFPQACVVKDNIQVQY